MKNNPSSLYIHIPFCEHICDYCDFPKLQYFRFLALKYLDSLKKELDSYSISDLTTIYVGGGTPTSLEDDLFEKLLQIIKPYSKNVKEYTFEANPESLTINKIKLLKEYGVNRVSIGVESTDDEILKLINRHHTFNDVKTAVRLLKENGIGNINLDLIMGLPQVSEKMLLKDIDNLISLDVKHISCYSLSIHEHTVFYLKGYKENEGDIERKFYDLLTKRLEENGFIHYEISNYAKNGYESLHNLTYWKNERYYGIGMGASGYINNERYKNTINLNSYINNKYKEENEFLTKEDEYQYQIMLNLRTIFGLDLEYIKKKFDIDLLIDKNKEIEELIEQKLLLLEDNKLIPTYEGMMILDQIILKLI